MFFISRFKITFSRIPATVCLILVNILVYLVLGLVDNRGFETLAYNSFLIDWGANVPALTFSGQFWRLLTCMFLHGGFLHLAMNMLALWSLGGIMELKLGPKYFLIIYFLSGLVGSMASSIWFNGQFLISCGASGAILGLFGVTLVYALKNRGRSEVSLSSLGLSLVLTFGAGAVANIDNAAHLGGFVTGILMTIFLVAAYQFKVANKKILAMSFMALFVGAPLLCIGFAYAHYYDSDLAQQLKVADLKQLLANVGWGDSNFQYTGAFSTNLCIDNLATQAVVSSNEMQKDQTGNFNALALAKLKSCGGASEAERQSNVLADAMQERFGHCQAVTQVLIQADKSAEGREIWGVIMHYCHEHGAAYKAIFSDEVFPVFNPKDYMDSEAKLQALMTLESEVQNPTPEQVKVANIFAQIFNKDAPIIESIMRESGCPYFSCWRF